MTIEEKLKDILIRIDDFDEQHFSLSLLPLQDLFIELKKYINYNSGVKNFDIYLNQSLLLRIDDSIQKCSTQSYYIDLKKAKEESEGLKKSAHRYVKLFREACKTFSVDALSKQIS